MTPIPRAALGLGLAGLIPFVWGAASQLFPGLAEMGLAAAGPRFVGPYVSLAYGTVILSFMSGVLWGFATKATGSAAATGYALSVLPALWAFFMVGGRAGVCRPQPDGRFCRAFGAGWSVLALGSGPVVVDAAARAADSGGAGLSSGACPAVRRR